MTLDLTNQRFGRLVAVKPTEERKRRNKVWLCQCDCGNFCATPAYTLKGERIHSCGCVTSKTTHGYAKRKKRHPLYACWKSIHNRCNNPNEKHYKDYGGRGIKICERWSYFPNFLADVGERPAGLTLDRTDNDGDYEPNNIRWTTPSIQMRNRRPFKAIEGFTEAQLITELARRQPALTAETVFQLIQRARR
jgi:hypothetical protein